jgi:CDP-diglyceride synthetase
LGYGFACIYGSKMLEVGNPRVACALACAIAAVISQVGDLAASAIKRNHDIKDYGHLIPGHGGILDRFDSMLFTAPAIYFAVTFLR